MNYVALNICIFSFEQISHIILVFPLLTLSKQMSAGLSEMLPIISLLAFSDTAFHPQTLWVAGLNISERFQAFVNNTTKLGQ